MEKEKVKNILEQIKKESFIKGYNATDEEAMGMLLSHYFEYDGVAVLKSVSYALEDSNFHSENEKVQEMLEKFNK